MGSIVSFPGPARRDFSLQIDRDYSLVVPITDTAGKPYIIPAGTTAKWWMGTDRSAPSIQKVSGPTGIQFIDASTISIPVDKADTLQLSPSSPSNIYFHAVALIDSSGKASDVAVGVVTLIPTFGV